MTIAEYAAYTISGILGLAVALYCFEFVYLKGKSKKQRLAQEWEGQGCVAEGRAKKVDLARSGDPSLEGSLQEDCYKVLYAYEAKGSTYEVTRRFLSGYPSKLKIYYHPDHPERCITANETSEVIRRGHGCLICILATTLTIGISGNLLLKLFGQ